VGNRLQLEPEVRDALALGRPVVALETSVVAHGLPPPANAEAARRCAAAVRESGAVPAFVAVARGRLLVGAGEAELERLADPASGTAKAGVRDLAALLVAERAGATTVSATCAAAARAGIQVVATGGIGGVHRRAAGSLDPLDVSSDLAEMARRRVCVVSSGPKAILDVPATAEWLEALGVPAIGWRTGELPAFFLARSGVRLEHRVEDEVQAATLLRIHWQVLERTEGVLLCVPPPSPLAPEELERGLAAAEAEAAARRVAGKQLTPFLLAALDRASGGQSRQANLALLEENARVAGRVAAALAGEGA
jgi:pseudouridine-5'-phosphate glycosidase